MSNCLDLFAGAGGLSEGFHRAGFKFVAHIEMDAAACCTLKTRVAYRWLSEQKSLDFYHRYLCREVSRDDFYAEIPPNILNTVLSYKISQENISNIFSRVDRCLGGQSLDMIVGGPPCQAYSIAGRARSPNSMKCDERNYLYHLYAKFLKRYRPACFVFENVLGLLSAKDTDGCLHFEKMKRLFESCGYSVEYRVLNACDFGVLQNRQRIILIGIRGNHRNFYPEIKKITNRWTVKEIFSDLPHLQAGGGISGPVRTLSYTGSYLYEAHIKSNDRQPVTLHWARPNTWQDLEIYRIAADEWRQHRKRISYDRLPSYLQTHKNINTFLDRFKVVASDLPYSQTVVAHIAKDGHYYIHPTQNRSLTPREAARLQTFPDDYYFESASGRPSRTSAFKQIGNAVPVLLAERIARALKKS